MTYLKLTFIALLLILVPSFGRAQTITQNQPLTFGKVALTDNSIPRVVTLVAGGTYTADPEYVFFNDPQLGNFTVDGYPPATPLTVSISTTTLTPMMGGGANFAVASTFTDPGVVVTDGTGSVTFDVGAIMSSDGSGSTHVDDLYEGTYTIMVSP